jgi:lysophospholipase L1-like esterase
VKKIIKLQQLLTALSLIVISASLAVGCPTISKFKFPDINCNQKFRLLFTGDSIVRGVGDEMHEDQWGYVQRIQKKYRKIDVQNLGVPGITSYRLLQDFRQNLNKKGSGITKKRSKESDAIVIAVGVNDFWDYYYDPEGHPISFTIRNIKRLVKVLKNELKTNDQYPEVFVATILPVAPVNEIRILQTEFVAELNQELLKYQSKYIPVSLRLDQISPTVLGEDGLHPTSNGYDVISNYVVDFIEHDFLTKLKKRHRDHDRDGIYDVFELPLFGTDELSPDTDGDTYTDGQEVFNLKSDPLDNTSPDAPVPSPTE